MIELLFRRRRKATRDIKPPYAIIYIYDHDNCLVELREVTFPLSFEEVRRCAAGIGEILASGRLLVNADAKDGTPVHLLSRVVPDGYDLHLDSSFLPWVDLTFVFTVRLPEPQKVDVAKTLPERTPLHPEALNIDDIGLGTKFRHYRNGQPYQDGLIHVIVSDPYKRGLSLVVDAKYRDAGGSVQDTVLYLADFGIIPFDGTVMVGPYWHPTDYSLAVQ